MSLNLIGYKVRQREWNVVLVAVGRNGLDPNSGCEADYRSTKCYVIMTFVNYNAINHVHYA